MRAVFHPMLKRKKKKVKAKLIWPSTYYDCGTYITLSKRCLQIFCFSGKYFYSRYTHWSIILYIIQFSGKEMKNGFNSKLNLENKGREGFILF